MSNKESLRPSYVGPDIETLEQLANSLGYVLSDLEQIRRTAQTSYRRWPKRRTNKTPRIIAEPSPILKSLHRSIVKNIFQDVDFPAFVKGGIHGGCYRADARLHLGAKLVLKSDIKDFFPSISRPLVRKVWTDFFGCTSLTADLLTDICIHRESLPQGAPASTYVANLIFFDTEHILFEDLRKAGFCYSRFVDDITISKSTALLKGEEGTVRHVLADFFCNISLNRT
jgi:hypothetical protein